MSDALIVYNGPTVPGDSNNSANAYVKRANDKSISVGQCNTTALNATAAFVAGAAVTGTASLTTLATVVTANATSAAFTITLPPATSSSGQLITVIKTDNAHTVTIAGAGSDNINGANTTALTTQYQAARLWCDGTQWWLI